MGYVPYSGPRKEWKVNNKERVKLQARKQTLKKYGLTIEDYEKMLESQKGLCAICRRTNMDGRALSVDHDHITGHNRGLLCKRCNYAIGLLGEVENLIRAIEYLQKSISDQIDKDYSRKE